MYDVLVIGGGAAGFYGAIHIAEFNNDLKVAILEQGKQVLGKVKVSGGGRCNVTHAEFNPKVLVFSIVLILLFRRVDVNKNII